jgi:purine-cytosine permease-like protein
MRNPVVVVMLGNLSWEATATRLSAACLPPALHGLNFGRTVLVLTIVRMVPAVFGIRFTTTTTTTTAVRSSGNAHPGLEVRVACSGFAHAY